LRETKTGMRFMGGRIPVAFFQQFIPQNISSKTSENSTVVCIVVTPYAESLLFVMNLGHFILLHSLPNLTTV
ncbi:MAG: hypothetical protein KDD67_16905, partial [Ignavibacteriae bacterium]|nr:hypothetical protein [Ignavibacteriota bacterium]